MKKSLATFLEIAATVTVLAVVLFSIGYQMIMDESHHYESDIDSQISDALSH